MKLLIDSQALIRHFNEEEAVRRQFEQKRALRDSRSSLPEEVLELSRKNELELFSEEERALKS